MSKIYPTMVNCNGNPIAAVDLETSGLRPGYHEIIQIAILPLDSELNPMLEPFYTTVKPEHPDRWEKASGYVHRIDKNELMLHAPDAGRVQDLLIEWFNNLDLPFARKLTPLAHNWAFESAFLGAWLGPERVDEIFHCHSRDSMHVGITMNDRAIFRGEEVPFNRVSLQSMCRRMGIENPNPHDALNDAMVEATLYRRLIQLDMI
jgi:DNA polymerase III epsilon subunit-like protein